MEIKQWKYEEFPDFSEIVPGAVCLRTTGNEIGVRQHHNVKYAEIDGVSLYLQILQPFTRNEPEKKYPCVVFVQGSAWLEQNVWAQCPMFARLASRGYVVAVVQYRHSGIAAFPAQIRDTKNAIRYMRIHAEDYHIDPQAIVVGGDSSGGHTAMFCGIFTDDEGSLFPGVSAEIKGILNYYGAVSLMYEDGYPSTENHHLPDSPEGMLMGGVNLREKRELCENASAECYVTPERGLVPVMILHGTKDRTVNVKQSVRLYHKMKEAGKDVQLYLVEGADHGGAEFWTDEICSQADAFIRYCLKTND